MVLGTPGNASVSKHHCEHCKKRCKKSCLKKGHQNVCETHGEPISRSDDLCPKCKEEVKAKARQTRQAEVVAKAEAAKVPDEWEAGFGDKKKTQPEGAKTRLDPKKARSMAFMHALEEVAAEAEAEAEAEALAEALARAVVEAEG